MSVSSNNTDSNNLGDMRVSAYGLYGTELFSCRRIFVKWSRVAGASN